MVKFYYDDYDFQKDKNYLIFYRGCFCPPSRGHFSLVERFSYLDNVKIYISQIGSEHRHGVPYELNRKIWKIYISKLLPKEKIILKKAYTTADVLTELKDIDVVIFLRGCEDENERKKERQRLKKYSPLLKELKRRRVKADFLFIDRPEKDILSATKMVEAIINRDKNLRFYFPENLEEKDFRYILRKLKEQKLK
jgi:hypothetical protein